MVKIKGESKEEEFRRVLSKAFEKERCKYVEKETGHRVRNIVKLVAKHYSGNPEELKRYFGLYYPEGNPFKLDHDDLLIEGVATSAYAMITGNFQPISKAYYGGLGITLDDSPENIVGKHHQYNLAKGCGNSFKRTVGRNNSFRDVIGMDNSFDYAVGHDVAFRYAKGRNEAFRNAAGLDDSFCNVRYRDSAFREGFNCQPRRIRDDEKSK